MMTEQKNMFQSVLNEIVDAVEKDIRIQRTEHAFEYSIYDDTWEFGDLICKKISAATPIKFLNQVHIKKNSANVFMDAGANMLVADIFDAIMNLGSKHPKLPERTSRLLMGEICLDFLRIQDILLGDNSVKSFNDIIDNIDDYLDFFKSGKLVQDVFDCLCPSLERYVGASFIRLEESIVDDKLRKTFDDLKSNVSTMMIVQFPDGFSPEHTNDIFFNREELIDWVEKIRQRNNELSELI